MKFNGYSIKLIQKNMYRIIDENGNMVGVIERNKGAPYAPALGAGRHLEPLSSPCIRGEPHREIASMKP